MRRRPFDLMRDGGDFEIVGFKVGDEQKKCLAAAYA